MERNKLSGDWMTTRRYMPGKQVGVRRPIERNGYIMEWDETRSKYVYQHRLVMEQTLGRLLISSEIVHHKNGDKQDNGLANLEVFSSHLEHIEHHVAEGTWGSPKGIPKPWLRKPAVACPVCGALFVPGRRTTSQGQNVDVATCSMSCGQTLRYQEPQPHGTRSRYDSGCHCRHCRGANTERGRRARARRTG